MYRGAEGFPDSTELMEGHSAALRQPCCNGEYKWMWLYDDVTISNQCGEDKWAIKPGFLLHTPCALTSFTHHRLFFCTKLSLWMPPPPIREVVR